MLWTVQGCGWNEQLEVGSSGSKCYKELRVVDDLNNLELLMISMTWTPMSSSL